MGENVKESIDFQEDDLTIEELMELDQDDTKSDEAEKSKNIKDFFAKKWKDLIACNHF